MNPRCPSASAAALRGGPIAGCGLEHFHQPLRWRLGSGRRQRRDLFLRRRRPRPELGISSVGIMLIAANPLVTTDPNGVGRGSRKSGRAGRRFRRSEQLVRPTWRLIFGSAAGGYPQLLRRIRVLELGLPPGRKLQQFGAVVWGLELAASACAEFDFGGSLGSNSEDARRTRARPGQGCLRSGGAGGGERLVRRKPFEALRFNRGCQSGQIQFGRLQLGHRLGCGTQERPDGGIVDAWRGNCVTYRGGHRGERLIETTQRRVDEGLGVRSDFAHSNLRPGFLLQ